MADEATLEMTDEGSGVGNFMEFMKQRDGGLLIIVENPWAGSTETGFGYTCSCNLSADQVKQLMQWLKTDDR